MHMYDCIIDAEYSDIHHYSNQVNCTVQKIIIIYTLSHNRIAPSGRASGSAGQPCYTVYIRLPPSDRADFSNFAAVRII